jgi:hypothetical protein
VLRDVAPTTTQNRIGNGSLMVVALTPFAVGRNWCRYFHKKGHAAKAISRDSFDRIALEAVVRLPSTVNRPKI